MLIFGKGLSVVQAIGHALRLHVSPRRWFGRSIESDNGILTETGCVLLIHHTRTAENSSPGIRCKSDTFIVPMRQVCTGRVSPVHVSPHRTVRIILEIQVIHAILVEHTVRVVHPAVSRCMMINRTEFLLVCHVERIRHFKFFPAK